MSQTFDQMFGRISAGDTRQHTCAECGSITPEIDGTWPVLDPDTGEFAPERIGDVGPEGFVCYECLAARPPACRRGAR